MFIFFFIIDIGFGIWVSLGNPWWSYLVNVFLLVLSASFYATNVVQDFASDRKISVTSIILPLIYLIPAFYVLRNHLLIFLLWLSIKYAESGFCAN